MENEQVVVIISGGMDSTTLLYKVMSLWGKENVHALSFNYGQKHKCELEKAKATCKKLGVSHKVLSLDVLNEVAPSALTRSDWKVPEGHYADENMKQTVVPNRNMVMLSLAAAFAMGIKASKLYYGAHAGDHCVVEEETIITKSGKVMIKDLVVGDEILSMNLDTHKVSFEKVTKKICNGFRKDILNIETEAGRSCSITSNHKVFVVERTNHHPHTGWEKEIIEKEAKDLKEGDFLICPFKQTIKENGEYPDVDLLPYCNSNHYFKLQYDEKYIWYKNNNKVNRFVPMKSFIKLLAWYITEGSIGSGFEKRANKYRLSIPQDKEKNPENYKEIEGLLKDWGFNICVSNSCMFVSGPTTNVFKKCGVNSFEKNIPEEYLMIAPQLWFNTLNKGDGHEITTKKQNKRYIYSTVSYKLKEQMCWLGVVLGYSVGVNITSNGLTYNITLQKEMGKTSNELGDSKIVKIKSISKGAPSIVYDIEVKNNHTFFCGKGAGLLISNSIYPDCRKEFIDSMRESIRLADWNEVKLLAPYWDTDKIGILKEGIELGVDYSLTHTCYNPNEAGESCGKCGSCTERLEAFEKNDVVDPLKYYN